VLVAVAGLLDVQGFIHLWRYRVSEGLIASVALLGVLAAGLLQGVVVGALLSLLLLLRAALSPRVPELGRLPDAGGYVDLERHPHALRPPGTLLVRCDSSILYMNAEHVLDEIMARLAARPDAVTQVVFSLETTPQLDLAGAEMLIELHRALAARGIALHLADMRDRVREALRDAGYQREAGGAVAHREIDSFLGR
jgi:MFS superfamily sulfate permease-like transporter